MISLSGGFPTVMRSRLFASLITVACSLGLSWSAAAAQPIILNEIMYHVKATPHKEAAEAEFIELYHLPTGDGDVSLKGWRFDDGVDFTFPDISLAPGEFLVVASSIEHFRQMHLEAQNVIGDYAGRLSNSGENIRLENAAGDLVDEVRYADEGFWARQVSTKLKGYDDWIWWAPHDGEGHSLELVQPGLSNDFGQNWAPSEAPGGTPGRGNSVRMENSPPLTRALSHQPAIPSSVSGVTVTASIVDESEAEVQATLCYRQDGAARFEQLPMAALGNGHWAATIPVLPDGTIVQYYVDARDATGLTKTFPAVERSASGGTPARQAVHLYQVDDSHDPAKDFEDVGAHPVYRFITTARELQMLRQLVEISGTDNIYDNHLSGTFITFDGIKTEVRHQSLARIRGHGSRSTFPPGLRLSVPSDKLLSGVADINLNTQFTQSQTLGAAIHQLAGFAAARSTPVRMRLNGEDWARTDSPQFGCYVHNEVLNGDYVESRFPGEDDGNLYRGVGNADLNDLGNDMERYRRLYSKRNHGSEDDYSDILALIAVLDQREPGDDYLEQVAKLVDIEQWARYFALDALLCNLEGGLPDGRGDDYALFRRKDGRFNLIGYDLDSILGMGDRGQNLNRSIFNYGNMAGLRRLFPHPAFRRLYFAQIRELVDTVFNTATLYPLIDDLLGHWIPEEEVQGIKDFIPMRITAVLNQIESSSVVGSTLPVTNGYHKTLSADFSLYGSFDMGRVQEVTVGGLRPRLNERSGMWLLRVNETQDFVRPGINAIPVILTDHRGAVVEEMSIPVWYDRHEVTEMAGSLVAGESDHWTAEDGPYLLQGEVVVPPEVTLTIASGATVHAAPDASLRVQGRLQAVGERNRRITFMGDMRHEAPGSWKGVVFDSGSESEEHVLEYCDLYHLDGDSGAALMLRSGSLRLHQVDVHEAKSAVLSAKGAGVEITRCHWSFAPQVDGASYMETRAAVMHLQENRFAAMRGDAPALSLATPAGGLMRILGNRFEGVQGPALSLEGPAWIDGNSFVDTSSASESRSSPFIDMPVKQAPSECQVTRNRWRGDRPLTADEATIIGQDNHPGSPPERYEAPRAVLDGVPRHSTPLRSVSLTVGGAGIVAFRYRLNDGPWSDAVTIGDRALGETLTLENLTPGTHQVTVIGQDMAGRWQSEDDPSLSPRWLIDPEASPVRLSEILAVNRQAVPIEGDYFDLIELTNDSDDWVELGGFRLTDDDDETGKFVFPAGTTIAPRGFLTVIADSEAGDGALRTGFGLNGEGETVSLYQSEAAGGRRIDSVTFGLQAADHSIGRIDEEWRLCRPTLGEANQILPLAKPSALRIQEWLACGSMTQPDEFIELVNAAAEPVSLTGLALTDNIPNQRQHRYFPALSFLGPGEARAFWTDGKPGDGIDHLDFKLANAGELIGLVDRDGRVLAFAAFGQQRAGRSMGRDESGRLVFLRQPTPGANDSAGIGAPSSAETRLRAHLRLTELHYHPPGDGDDEFLELTNIGDESLTLEGLRFVDGISFVFPKADLAPNASIVVIANRAAFEKSYGRDIPVAGTYEGKLSNGGEKLALETASGMPVLRLEYSDDWHKESDGQGYSLELDRADAVSLESKSAWRLSRQQGGTPGTWDGAPDRF